MTTAVAVQQLKPITAAERKEAELKLQKAKVQLIVGHPFWAQIVFNRKIALDDNVPTAYITARGHITVGTRFVLKNTVQQLVFLLAHESMHYAMLHFLRRAHRDPAKWNIAGDAVINDLLIDGKVGEFIEGGVNMPGSKDKTAEKVYEELPDNDGGEGYAPGTGFQDMQDEGGADKLTEQEKREIEQQVRVELAQAAQVARQQGKLPASLERIINEIVNPLTPWHQLLERYMTGFVSSDYSWRRPRKAMMAQGFYTPSVGRIPSMGPVVVAVDTSGSIGEKELAHFFGHMNRILEVCRPEKMFVVPCDARVHETSEFTPEDLPLTPCKLGGGGGTAFEPVFDWIDEQDVQPEVLIYLTDMYGSFPEDGGKRGFETVWLSISDIKTAPFGSVITYRMDD